MTMHRWVPFLGILLGLATVESIFSVGVCRGWEKALMPPWSSKINKDFQLIFVKNGREKVIANVTQSLDPSFGFRDEQPYIPEMSQKYEGEYYWRRTTDSYVPRDKYTRLYVKDCTEDRRYDYGTVLRLSVMEPSAVALVFQRNKRSRSMVLWSRLNAVERGARGTVKGDIWTAERATKADTGTYSLLNAKDITVYTYRVQVQTSEEYLYMIEAAPDWRVYIPIPLLEVKVMYGRMELFKDGLMNPEAFNNFEGRIQLQANDTGSEFRLRLPRTRDGGEYTFHDSSGQLAISRHLHGEYEEHEEYGNEHDPFGLIYPISIALGVLMGLTCCCWGCLKILNDDDEKAEVTATSPEAEPNTHVHEPLEMPGSNTPLQPRSNAPSSDNIEHPPHYPWANSPPPFFSSGSPSCNPVPQPPVSDPAPSYQPPAPYVPYQPYVPEPVSSSPPPYVPYVPYQPPISDPAPSSYQPPAPYVPYQPPSEPAAAGGAGDSSDLTAPTAPSLDIESQFQPRGWGGAMDDFLSSSPLCMDSNTPEGATYNSDKLNF